MKPLIPVIVLALAFASGGRAWGEIGHRTVGYLAQMYFTADAENLFTELVRPSDTFDISDGAVWADNFNVQQKRPWSKPWHYIDAKDNPPDKCTVNFSQDCDRDKKCVVAAIANQTRRLNRADLKADQQAEALKFLLHFLADVTQPLHTETKCRGGNELMVQWGDPDSRLEKLHQVWDSLIINKMRRYKPAAGGDPNNAHDKAFALTWAKELKKQLDAGQVALVADDECIDVDTAQDCALAWASEANAYVCTHVLKDVGTNLGPDECEKCCQWDWQGPADISQGWYYDGAVPVVQSQIAKAGWRLGQWINALAEQRKSMRERGVVFEGQTLKVQS